MSENAESGKGQKLLGLESVRNCSGWKGTSETAQNGKSQKLFKLESVRIGNGEDMSLPLGAVQ